MEKFKLLIEDESLYPRAFVEKFGESDQYWQLESFRCRELSLRHDMICILLCNTQEQNTITLYGGDASNLESLSNIEDLLSEEAVEALENTVKLPLYQRQFDYRSAISNFIVLEGDPAVATWQHASASKWGTTVPRGKWDIIDKEHRKFIELKVTGSIDREIEEFEKRCSNDPDFYSLIIVNPNDGSLTKINYEWSFSGETKVIDFLAKRRMVMTQLGIHQGNLVEEEKLFNKLFTCKEFKAETRDWVKSWHRQDSPTLDLDYLKNLMEEIPQYRDMDLKNISDKLEDPSTRSNEIGYVMWKGKLLPEVLYYNQETPADTDENMVKDMIDRVIGTEDPLLLKLLDDVRKHYLMREMKSKGIS